MTPATAGDGRHNPDNFEQIRLNLLSRWLLKATGESAVIALTARQRGDGVTTVVTGLARAFAAADPGPVLVIDANGGSERNVGRLLGLRVNPMATDDAPGTLGHAIVRAEGPGFDVLAFPCSAPPNRETAARAREAIAVLRPRYATILIDTGGIDTGWAPCWMQASDYRVLVVDGSGATREVLAHLRRQLGQSSLTLDGFILNRRPYPIPRSLYWLAN